MKQSILIFFLFLCVNLNAQDNQLPTAPDSLESAQMAEQAYKEYLTYKPCMACGDQWQKGSGGNSYQSRQSHSQQNIISQNGLASQTVSSGKRFMNGLFGVILGTAAAALTYSIMLKTNTSISGLIK